MQDVLVVLVALSRGLACDDRLLESRSKDVNAPKRSRIVHSVADCVRGKALAETFMAVLFLLC